LDKAKPSIENIRGLNIRSAAFSVFRPVCPEELKKIETGSSELRNECKIVQE
jgi:hypothetical protein